MPRLRILLFTLIVTACPNMFGQTYDVIIRGGHVIDGTGNPWIRADVGIRAGHIVRIGPMEGAQATREIDATNQVTTPGFIDMHTHSEYALLYDGNAQSKIREGVTTEVVGEATSPGPIEGPSVGPAKEMLRAYKARFDMEDSGRILPAFAEIRQFGQPRFLRFVVPGSLRCDRI